MAKRKRRAFTREYKAEVVAFAAGALIGGALFFILPDALAAASPPRSLSWPGLLGAAQNGARSVELSRLVSNAATSLALDE